MKIEIDFDLCEANALCEQFAPKSFRLDDDDNLELLDEHVDDQNEAAVRKAVRSCPRAALALVTGD
jgi:ferredoxin